MREAEVKRKIIESVREDGGYARRIEDKFTVGMPDIVLIPVQCPVVWLEVKLVASQVFHPSMRQLVELMKLRRAPHSTSFVVGWKRGLLYISQPKKDIPLDDCIEQKTGESVTRLIKRAIEYEQQQTNSS